MCSLLFKLDPGTYHPQHFLKMEMNPTPKYERRFGFYLLCIAMIAEVFFIMFFALLPMKTSLGAFIPEEIIHEVCTVFRVPFYVIEPLLNHEFDLSALKLLFCLTMGLTSVYHLALLKMPKLTLEKGHFWIIFGVSLLLSIFMQLSSQIFVNFNIEGCKRFMEVFKFMKLRTSPVELHEMIKATFDTAIADLDQGFSFGSFIGSILYSALFSLIHAGIMTMDEDYNKCCSCLKCLKPYKPIPQLPTYDHYKSAQFVEPMPEAQHMSKN